MEQVAAERRTERRTLGVPMRRSLALRPAILVRGSSRRITTMQAGFGSIREYQCDQPSSLPASAATWSTSMMQESLP
jgi:hypothetical protein